MPAEDLLGISNKEGLTRNSVVQDKYALLHPMYRVITTVLDPQPRQTETCSADLVGYLENGLHRLTSDVMVYLDIVMCSLDDRSPTKFTESAIFELLPLQRKITSLCSYNELPWLKRAALEQALFSRSLSSHRTHQNSVEGAFWTRNDEALTAFTTKFSIANFRFLRNNLFDYVRVSKQFYKDKFKENNMFTEIEPDISTSIEPFYQVIVLSALGMLMACFGLCAELGWKSKSSMM